MPSGGLTVPLKFWMSSYKMTCCPVTKPVGLTYRWLAREDQTPSLIALPETRAGSRLPQLLAITAFSFCPPPLREMHGLPSHYVSIDQMLYFLWIFHFHIMEGVPSLVGILLVPIGICGPSWVCDLISQIVLEQTHRTCFKWWAHPWSAVVLSVSLFLKWPLDDLCFHLSW